jgi:hypothetical protein
MHTRGAGVDAGTGCGRNTMVAEMERAVAESPVLVVGRRHAAVGDPTTLMPFRN